MSEMTRYDVIIIGTGAGGGTLAHRLAPSGKRILLLERGDYVPREKDNWSTRAVNVEGKYNTKETWRTAEGADLHPHTNYWVGGNTKFYGAALFRLRQKDFDELKAEAENKVKVKFISAAAADPKVVEQVAQALKSRLGREVEMELEVDAALIGGAIIRAEDMVIDGSVRARLEKLAHALIDR